MKIHSNEERKLVRIEIAKGNDREYIILEDTEVEEVKEYVSYLMLKFGQDEPKGERIKAQIRNYTGRKMGSSKTISCFGITPIELKGHIESEL